MKCFACGESIKGPKSNWEIDPSGTFEVSALCPLCGACVNIYELESNDVAVAVSAFERACRE